MSDTINFIKIADENTVTGNLASLTFDIDITGEPVQSDNPKAPVYRLFAQTPRHRSVEIGGIWRKMNARGGEYLTLTVNTGYGKLNANLGRYPGQDDDSLMAVIPWD